MTNGKTTKIQHNFRKKPSKIGEVKMYLIHSKELCSECKGEFENKSFPKNGGLPYQSVLALLVETSQPN